LSGVVYKIGDLVAGRYKVRDIVGSGGAGVVYRAHDQEIDVEVALKVINAKLLQTPDERKLFSKEIKTAKKLSHQNVVRIFDEGKDAERVFFTMQFLDGLSAAVTGEYFLLVLAGGIAHRDSQQEAVQLAFRQNVGAFELKWILGRDYHERRD
jgi:serine/threonine protein kinase